MEDLLRTLQHGEAVDEYLGEVSNVELQSIHHAANLLADATQQERNRRYDRGEWPGTSAALWVGEYHQWGSPE